MKALRDCTTGCGTDGALHSTSREAHDIYISTNYLLHLGGDGGEVREAEEVDEPHADEDGGEVLAHEVDGDQVDGEQRAAPGHQLGVDDPVSQVASNQPGQAVGHTTGDTKYMILG